MKVARNFAIIFAILLIISNASAQQDDLQEMFAKIKKLSPSSFLLGKFQPQVQTCPEAVVFTSQLPPSKPGTQALVVTTKFFHHSSTIDKDVEVIHGQSRDGRVHMRMALDNQGQPFSQILFNLKGVPLEVYERSWDIFAYMQSAASNNNVELKEWIYAREPNCPQGTCYRWLIKGEDFNRRLVFNADGQGNVEIQRQMVIRNIDPMDYQRQRHIIEAVKKALKNVNVHISGEDVVGKALPVYYWTKEGVPKMGTMRLADKQILEIIINEPSQAYPLLIDPTLWLSSL